MKGERGVGDGRKRVLGGRALSRWGRKVKKKWLEEDDGLR